MPYKFPDHKGSGRDVIITNKSQLTWYYQPTLTLANTQGAVTWNTASISSPYLTLPDPTGFFAPVWGSGELAVSYAIAYNAGASGGSQMLLAYGPLATGSIMYVFLDASRQIIVDTANNSVASYIKSSMTGAPAAGSRLLHVEWRTGTVRECNIWVDSIMATQTRVGPTGTPLLANGTESLILMSNTGGVQADLNHPIGSVSFKRGRWTDAERFAHLQALNAA